MCNPESTSTHRHSVKKLQIDFSVPKETECFLETYHGREVCVYVCIRVCVCVTPKAFWGIVHEMSDLSHLYINAVTVGKLAVSIFGSTLVQGVPVATQGRGSLRGLHHIRWSSLVSRVSGGGAVLEVKRR